MDKSFWTTVVAAVQHQNKNEITDLQQRDQSIKLFVDLLLKLHNNLQQTVKVFAISQMIQFFRFTLPNTKYQLFKPRTTHITVYTRVTKILLAKFSRLNVI